MQSVDIYLSIYLSSYKWPLLIKQFKLETKINYMAFTLSSNKEKGLTLVIFLMK